MRGDTWCGGWERKLARVRGELDRWRRRRRRGDKIPAELWQQAVALARECGVSRTAGALRLDYYGLKRRLSGSAAEAPAQFVELPLASMLGAAGACVVEIEDDRRARLRIEIHGAAPGDIESLARALWGLGR